MNQSYNNCLLCNSSLTFELKKYQKYYLTKCSECGFVFCKKTPTHEELVSHYQTYTRGREISAITIKRYHQILDTFEAYRKSNNLLDIGCGDACFLDIAKQRGWNVFGTEFTEEAIDLCTKKGITMHHGILNPANYESLEFDVITSFEVIEHINNPKSEIQNIRTILRQGGVFYFTTPNFNSIVRFIRKENWNVIQYPEHLSYYTAKTINHFLAKEGFKKIRIETTGISINRLQGKSNTPSIGPTSGKVKINKDENIREKTETLAFFKATKFLVNFILNLFKIGDSIKGFYQKN